jgi:hypothetical protein
MRVLGFRAAASEEAQYRLNLVPDFLRKPADKYNKECQIEKERFCYFKVQMD